MPSVNICWYLRQHKFLGNSWSTGRKTNSWIVLMCVWKWTWKIARMETNVDSSLERPGNRKELQQIDFPESNLGVTPTHLSENNACSIPCHDETITLKLSKSVTVVRRSVICCNFKVFDEIYYWYWLRSSPHSFCILQRSKVSGMHVSMQNGGRFVWDNTFYNSLLRLTSVDKKSK